MKPRRPAVCDLRARDGRTESQATDERRRWTSLAMACCILFFQGCGGGGSQTNPGGPVNPATAVIDLTFDLTRRAGLPGGTVFEVSAGDVRCAAGFVNAVQSRVYSNQNDLEFWCREGAGAPLQFQSIGKPSAGQFASSITNLNGRLYEMVGRSVHENGSWRSLRSGELPIPDDVFPISVLRQEAETFAFTVYGSRCEGISLYSTRGYHGTYREADWQESSATWTDGDNMLINVGHQVKIGPVPPATANTCVDLTVSPGSNAPSDWVYAVANLEGGLVYGGSAEDLSSCASLLELDFITTQASEIPLNLCAPGFVTEIYSLTPWRTEILVGNFPIGTLYALSPSSDTTRLTTFGVARADDLPDPSWGGPYRESQSVVVSGGRVFMGMYPWAELIVQDDETTAPTVYRLMTQPAKGTEFAPYATRLAAADNVPKDRPYYDRTWAQRIPTIAVLSGRLCASTSNRTGEDLRDWGTAITPDEARPYGEVFCTTMPNHIMGNVGLNGRLRFRVTAETISIAQNGVGLAEVRHSLPESALSKLRNAVLTTGRGDYGPIAGTLSAIQ